MRRTRKNISTACQKTGSALLFLFSKPYTWYPIFLTSLIVVGRVFASTTDTTDLEHHYYDWGCETVTGNTIRSWQKNASLAEGCHCSNLNTLVSKNSTEIYTQCINTLIAFCGKTDGDFFDGCMGNGSLMLLGFIVLFLGVGLGLGVWTIFDNLGSDCGIQDYCNALFSCNREDSIWCCGSSQYDELDEDHSIQMNGGAGTYGALTSTHGGG